MNCQMFSWPLSSGARGGSGISVMLLGTLRILAPCSRLDRGAGLRVLRADLNRDLIEMELHGFAGRLAAPARLPSKLGTDRTEQIGRLGALIVNGARARAFLASDRSACSSGRPHLVWHHTSIGVQAQA